MQDREHEAQVGRDRRLPGEQQLDPLLDAHVALVDVVVKGDHLVGELLVPRLEGFDRTAQSPEHELPLLLERRLQNVEILLERSPHPNRPVT